MKSEIDAVRATLPKYLMLEGKRLNFRQGRAAEEIVIKQHILDNYASQLSPNDITFLEKQIEILKKWGLTLDQY